MRKLMLVALCTFLVTGCATQTYYVNGRTTSEPTVDKMQSFFLSGIGQEQELDAAGVCGGADKVVKVQSKLEFVDWFLGAISFGIYTPRHAKVYCRH